MATEAWRNWSGSVRATPETIAAPRDEGELARLVEAHAEVRVTGAGHSFMPLCETDGLLLHLDDMAGDLDYCEDGETVWAPAGWSLAKLTAKLWEHGRSLPNQGDVNPQSLAGAISTGTHGTGAGLGSLSTIARGFRLMLADGSVLTCDSENDPDAFEAARVSLGLLGIMLAVKIETVPAYHLAEELKVVPFGEIVEQWHELAARYRHVEFWSFPYSDKAILKTLDLCDPCPPPKAETDMGETIFKFYCGVVRRAPALMPSLQRFMMRVMGPESRRGPAYAIFPSQRTTRFEEMEYELPEAAGFAALKEVTAMIRDRRTPVSFPFEFRLVAEDDIWLSPFNRGPCTAISMHQYAPMNWREPFAEAEAVFRAHGGRPHWAKRHTLGYDDVTALYPKADAFRAVRARLDPEAKFANAHMAELFLPENRG